MAKVETVVFLSLILDLFAFTIPLPLFPRLIEWYTVVSMRWQLLFSAHTQLIVVNLSIEGEFRPERVSFVDPPFSFSCEGLVLRTRHPFAKMGHRTPGWIHGLRLFVRPTHLTS